MSSRPSFHAALVHSCHAVTEAQLSSSSPHWCCLESGWPLVPIPSSAAGGQRAVSTILCARATLLSCLKARSKSHFFPEEQLPFPCVPTPISPPSVTAALPGDSNGPRGAEAPAPSEVADVHCVTLGHHLKPARNHQCHQPHFTFPCRKHQRVRVGNLSRRLTFEKIPN